MVGAKANPPKNPSSPPKKGNVMAINIVKAEAEKLNISYIRKLNYSMRVFKIGTQDLIPHSTYPHIYSLHQNVDTNSA